MSTALSDQPSLALTGLALCHQDPPALAPSSQPSCLPAWTLELQASRAAPAHPLRSALGTGQERASRPQPRPGHGWDGATVRCFRLLVGGVSEEVTELRAA